MAVVVQCPNAGCARRARLPDATLGRAVRCRHCGRTFTAVAAAPDSPTPVPAAETVGHGPASAEAGLPAAIGRFQVRGRLGAGAFGTVYRAYDPQLDREVALKVPRPGALDNPIARERFLREAKAAARLRHPAIVPVYQAGARDAQPYIAAAFVPGRTLAEVLAAGPLPVRRAAEIVQQLAEALAYAHDQGVVHRDVKPANVMIDPQGRAYLMDFGLARRRDDGDRLTQDGSLLGTPAYMAPEQAAGQGGEARPAGDQYSLGVVLYELLTGQTPFTGPPPVVLYSALHTAPTPPRRLNPAVPRDLETVCLKALAKRPEDRYPSCLLLAGDLRRCLEGQPVRARRQDLGERLVRAVRREPALAITAGVVVACLLGAAVVASGHAARLASLADQEARAKVEAERAFEAARAARQKAEQAHVDEDAARRQEARLRSDIAAKEQEIAKAEADLRQLGAEVRALEKQAVKDDATIKLAEGRLRQAEEAAERLRKEAEALFRKAGVLTFPVAYAWSPYGSLTARFTSDGNRIVVIHDQSGTFTFVDALTGKEVRPPAPPVKQSYGMVLSTDGKRRAMVVAERKGGALERAQGGTRVQVRDVEGDRLTLDSPEAPNVYYLTFSPDGRWLAGVAVEDKQYVLRLWDPTGAREGRTLGPVTSTGHRAGAFSPDGRLLAWAGSAGAMTVWATDDGKEVASYTVGDPERQGKRDFGGNQTITSVAFSPDGKHLAGVRHNLIQIWDAKTGVVARSFKYRVGVHAIAYSPDGRWLVGAGGSYYGRSQLFVWDTTTGRLVRELKGHRGAVVSVAFSPDGRRLVTAGTEADRTLKVWDVSFLAGNR